MSPQFYDPDGQAVEIDEGRGDLRYSSGPLDTYGAHSVDLIGGVNVSYARLFTSQWSIAAAVMRMLTWSIRVPLKGYRRTGDDSREPLTDHPLADALVTPWDRASRAQLTMALLGPVLVHGNSTTSIDQGARNKIRFAPKDWRFTVPMRPDPMEIVGWEISDGVGGQQIATIDEILHIAYWSPIGPIGVSPLQQLGTTISIEDAAQRYQQGIFRNGARPPSAITTDGDVLKAIAPEREDRNRLMADLRTDIGALYSGLANSGRPALLPPGLDWKIVGHTAVEAALIDQRKVAREEVASVYQIPPPMLGILDRATFNNIETQREMAYTDTLGPPLVLIEQAINAQLVNHVLREPDIYVEFDFAGVLRGDRLKEIQALREAIEAGLMTRNEGRRTLNMPHSDQAGMNDFTYNANNQRPVGTTSDNTVAGGGEPTDVNDPEGADQ